MHMWLEQRGSIPARVFSHSFCVDSMEPGPFLQHDTLLRGDFGWIIDSNNPNDYIYNWEYVLIQ